jgi:hypothetical protein
MAVWQPRWASTGETGAQAVVCYDALRKCDP